MLHIGIAQLQQAVCRRRVKEKIKENFMTISYSPGTCTRRRATNSIRHANTAAHERGLPWRFARTTGTRSMGQWRSYSFLLRVGGLRDPHAHASSGHYGELLNDWGRADTAVRIEKRVICSHIQNPPPNNPCEVSSPPAPRSPLHHEATSPARPPPECPTRARGRACPRSCHNRARAAPCW